ncbi:MAG: serine hydrolase [Patescibacteria group bacterium]|jgi:D-alanyl-D-alanine carboxypeptidase
MFEAVLNLFLAAIFLQAQATNPADAVMPANSLPLAQQKIEARLPEKAIDSESLGVRVSAKSFIVVEPETGAVLYEKNSQDCRPIASLTKLMTALVFLEHNPGWDKQYTMTADDFRVGAKPALMVGDVLTVRELFYTMLISSANEAAVALAKSTGLTPEEFVGQMNLYAKLLAMDSSQFSETTGLSVDNKASAEDVIKLIKVAFSHSEIRKALGFKSYNVSIINKNLSRHINSTDMILKAEFGYRGDSYKLEAGKTGTLPSAGYCFASQVKDQNNRRLLIAVLGSSSTYDRFTDTKSLAYWVFNNFSW